MKRLLNYLQGYVVINIRGSGVERFINLAVQRGIHIWDICRLKDGTVLAKVQLSGIRSLRHVARMSGCRFKIRGKSGLPFRIKFFQKRKMLAVGAVFFVISLYLLSSFIFFVEVTGPEPFKLVNPQMVKRLAEEKGVKAGRPKWLMDYKGAERYLIKEIPQITWVHISDRGTKLEIEIVEKVMPEPGEKDKKPGNVVAQKDGIITEILVMKGVPLVKPGDTVYKGQVLISGIITPEPLQENDPSEVVPEIIPQKVKADGIVRARVWYRGYGECPVIETGRKNTGRKEKSITLEWKEQRVNIWGPDKAPYKYYIFDSGKQKMSLWRNITLPVEIITTVYWEQETYRKEWGTQGAWQEAGKIALQAARRQVPPRAKILNRQIKPVEGGNPALQRAYVLLETEEDIGRLISIE